MISRFTYLLRISLMMFFLLTIRESHLKTKTNNELMFKQVFCTIALHF